MAPKRKDPPFESTEPLRRSTRTSESAKPESTSAPAPSKAKPASKPKKEAPAAKEAEPAEEEEKTEKKAKTSHTYAVGDIVKDIKLKDENDKEVSLADVYNKSGIVLFSYPKANTPGCTNQACGYRDIHSDIKAAGYEVFGISSDSPKAQLVRPPLLSHNELKLIGSFVRQSWKTSKSLGYSFFCDPKRELLGALGSTADKKRCHWVIEKGGKLLEAKLGVKPADDPSNALKFIKSL